MKTKCITILLCLIWTAVAAEDYSPRDISYQRNDAEPSYSTGATRNDSTTLIYGSDGSYDGWADSYGGYTNYFDSDGNYEGSSYGGDYE